MMLKIAAALYTASAATALATRGTRGWLWVFLLPALLANAGVVVLRYHRDWPMMPMYFSCVALPLVLGPMAALAGGAGSAGHRMHNWMRDWVRPTGLSLTALIALAAVLFPKDYYLPFIKSQTLTAHLFLWFGVVGRGCFLMGGVLALAGLRSRTAESGALGWTVWGFACWTLSMFSGELWSYLGWGTPVVWDEPAIATTMATWFFYVCLLHLHLTGSWSAYSRKVFTAAGIPLVLVLNCYPELGPLRWPF